MNNFLQQITKEQINIYQDQLRYSGIVEITSCFTQGIIRTLSNETRSIFHIKSKRKDFLSAHTNTPRNMSTVSECDITDTSKLIKNFYYSKELLKLLSEIASEKVDFLHWSGERYVINGLIHNDDTHGWHWDDYAYALVFIAETPESGAGGEVECIANTSWIKSNPDIQRIVSTRPSQLHHFQSGSFYFMKSDTTLHRVTKIAKSHKRLSLAMSYCNQADLQMKIDHSTVYDLYG